MTNTEAIQNDLKLQLKQLINLFLPKILCDAVHITSSQGKGHMQQAVEEYSENLSRGLALYICWAIEKYINSTEISGMIQTSGPISAQIAKIDAKSRNMLNGMDRGIAPNRLKLSIKD